jgi:hypothetical protein
MLPSRAGEGTFAEVPKGHPAYDLMYVKSDEYGFSTHALGCFADARKAALIRMQVGMWLQSAYPVLRTASDELLARPRNRRWHVTPKTLALFSDAKLLREVVEAMRKLTGEFAPELRVMGADVELIETNLGRIAGNADAYPKLVARFKQPGPFGPRDIP